jgi:hypothetical protein
MMHADIESLEIEQEATVVPVEERWVLKAVRRQNRLFSFTVFAVLVGLGVLFGTGTFRQTRG